MTTGLLVRLLNPRADSPSPDTDKTCTGCGRTLPATRDFFHLHPVSRDGLKPRCKDCQCLAQKNRYAASPKRSIAHSVEWGRRNPGRRRQHVKTWEAKNPDAKLGFTQDWRARNRGAFIERISRRAVFERDGYICGICGQLVSEGELSIDHVIPIACGGKHEYGNVQTAHRYCNAAKGQRLIGSVNVAEGR